MPIRRKLIILFLSIAIIPILFIGLLNFSNTKNELLTARTERLEVIADLKVDKIKTFFDDLKGDMQAVQDYFNIKTNLPIVTEYSRDRANPEYIKAKAMLDGQLRTWVNVRKEINDFMLLSPEGKIVYVVNQMHEQQLGQALPDPEGKAFEEGKKGIYLSNVFRNPHPGLGYNFGMLITAPVYDFEKRFVGVIAFEIDMGPIYSFIQDTTGLGQTGETLIVQKKISQQGTPDYKGRDGEYVLFLNPLRHDSDAALKKIVFMAEKRALPCQRVVKGENGSGYDIDYRDKKVLAAWRYIPSLNWGLVAKMDMQEILAPVNVLRHLTIIICVIVGAIVGIIALVISNSISNPIHILHKGTEIIGSGNLDYKVGTDAKDEIGQLSRAFDQMTSKLKAQLEETKAVNQQLRASNQQLRATEQQLRASNQQLRASEQQLRASNEQLRASEQQLRAANEQLQASEQQLRATNQQLRANEQQLRAEITERKKIEDKIEEQRKFLEKVLQSLTYPFYVIDVKDYTIKMTNSAAGIGDLSKGLTCYALTHKRDSPCTEEHVCTMKEVVRTKKPVVVEHIHYDKDGNARYVEVHGYPIFDKEGNVVQMIEYTIDITERKKIGESSRLVQLGRLVSAMAHEVNNPLMIISGNAQLSLMEGTKEEEIKNNLKIIMEECLRAKNIIQRLLKFSRPSKGETKEVDINKSIEAVVGIVEHQFKLVNVEIKRNYPENLPLISIDEQQMQELFMNLINNAVEAMPDGGAITITTSLEGDFLRIDFKDSGSGMTEEVKKKVFEPFFTTKEKGTGLGLSVCYGIIKAHNGEIKFESELNKGTTVSVLLPLGGGKA